MYGIGYAHSNLWGTASGKTSGWGQYVVEAGAYTQILSVGGTWSLGEFNRNGNKVWDAGNDGAGSGLDADLLDGQLDGQQGSYYLPTTGKAADSNLFDGIDSNRFVYGTNTAKVTRWDGNWNTMFSTYNTGFIDNASGTNGNPDGFTHHHGFQVRHDNMGNQWGYQFIGSYHPTYPSLFHRSVNAGTWNSWKEIWDSGNDGSGSGLDADLLDGVQGASFLRSDANDTATGDISFNGQLYFNSDSTGNYTEGARFNQSTSGWGGMAIGGIRNSINGISGGWWFARNPSGQLVMAYQTSGNAAGLMLPTSGYNLQFRSQNVWNAGNDGAGSGLDADLLDGQQGSYYAPASHAHSNYLTAETLSSTNTVTVTGLKYFKTAGTMASPLIGSSPSLQAYSSGGNYAAYMGFHRSGHYAINWGLDTSNAMVLGGWSSSTTAARMSIGTNGLMASAVQGTLWGSSNDGSGSGLDADLLDGLELHTGRNDNANKVVRTQVNGYCDFGWINTTSGVASGTPTRIYCSQDAYKLVGLILLLEQELLKFQ